jgi:uncharacterized protein (TIGR03437 family)
MSTAGVSSAAFNLVGLPPSWLTVTPQTGNLTGTVASGAVTLTYTGLSFQANAVAGTLAPGTYSGSISFNSQTLGMATSSIPVTLHVISATTTDQFNCTSANATQTWDNLDPITVGISCATGGQDVNFTAAAAGITGMTVSPAGGIAFPWGTSVTATIPVATLKVLSYGASLSGTVTFTPDNGASNVVINVNINIAPGSANITGYSIAELPVDLVNDHTVVVTGTNFVAGITQVAAVATSSLTVPCTNGMGGYTIINPSSVQIVSPTTMIVTLNHSTYLSAPAKLCIQVTNPANSGPMPSTPLTTLSVVTTPIIYSITNAGSFVQPATGSNPQVSPYEIISIFGANFDLSNGVEVQGNLLTAPFAFGTTMNNSNGKPLYVTFCKGSTTTGCAYTGTYGSNGFLANAPLIFVSDTQINAIVPDEIAAYLGPNSTTKGASVLVSVNGNTNDKGFLLDTQAQTPGVFTPGGSGQGLAAVLVGPNQTLNSQSNPLTKGSNTANNWVSIYLTGMGEPNGSTNADTATTSSTGQAACVSTDYWLGIINGGGGLPTSPAPPVYTPSGTFSSIDGTIFMTNAFWQGVLPPCLPISAATATGTGTGGVLAVNGSGALVNPGVAVTIGGLFVLPADITYAGFTPGSVAGLYQINVTLPTGWSYSGSVPAVTAASASGTSVPLVVYVNGVPSQTGATIWVN